MAEKLDSNAILEAIRDGFARCSTEKQVLALADSVKTAFAGIEERFGTIQTKLRALESNAAEVAEADRKEHTKTRTHVTEQIETMPAGGDDEATGEAIEKAVDKYVGEAKGLLKLVIGDDPETLGAIRGKIRSWVGKGGRKALDAGDDE